MTLHRAVVRFAYFHGPFGVRPDDREADPINEPLTRRHARISSADARARRYALRSVQPSPARRDAPEPDAWLPIDLTAELEAIEALDLTGELELLELEEGAVDLDRELAELEANFWRTAETEHPFLTGELPVVAEGPAPISLFAPPAPEPEPAPGATAGPEPGPFAVPAAEPVALAGPAPARPTPPDATVDLAADRTADVTADLEPLPVPEEYAQVRPNRPAIAGHRRAVRLRRRLILTILCVAVGAAFVGVAAQVLGGTHPRRDVTVSIDGRASTIVTRAGTVGDLLAAQGVVLHPGDEVIPNVGTSLQQGMPIHILRAFRFTIDADGVVAAHRSIQHDLARVRSQFHVAAAMVRVDGDRAVGRGSHLVFRTPHDVQLVVDGASTQLPHQTALDVRELLAARRVTLGPNDQVEPPLTTRLSAGLAVHVYRLTADEVVESKSIPFPTQYRDDPSLAAGHLATIQAGRNGVAHVVSKVVRKDGTIVQWTELHRDVVQAPVTQILARGTKPSGSQRPPALPVSAGHFSQEGTATWYQSHAGPGACAHLTLPFGTIVTITNLANGRTAQCRVGDRGPQAWTGHIIDLNPDVFSQLAPLGTGTIHVRLSAS
ncbi:MAG: G5 domain-containing protein [Acidimicrobiia bacterium]